MASSALLRRIPAPFSQVFHPLRAMRVLAAAKSRLPGSSNLTCQPPAMRSSPGGLRPESLRSQGQGAREIASVDSLAQGLKGLAFALAMAGPVVLLAPHEASAGEILRLSAAEIDPGTAKLAIAILGPLFTTFNLMFIVRIVMSWYPQIPAGKFPFSIAYAPTEPVLGPTRRLIPPVGGVDVAPVIWVALMSFLNEVLLGQQGLLVLLSQQQP